jgi:hypothetical protein
MCRGRQSYAGVVDKLSRVFSNGSYKLQIEQVLVNILHTLLWKPQLNTSRGKVATDLTHD